MLNSRLKFRLLILLAGIIAPLFAYAWGAEGHKMVADIARKKLNPGVEQKVQKYLDTMSFEEASVWMDNIRSVKSLDYMKPWHYVNVEKDSVYRKNPKGDIVSVLDSIIKELHGYKTMQDADVARDLRIVFHLCGDIAQPLHTGYGTDKGGNTVSVKLNGKTTNLHHVWDTDIITENHLTADDCLKLYKRRSKECKQAMQYVGAITWMNDARMHLSEVYDFKDGAITSDYLHDNCKLAKKQLLKGGLHLAAVLNEIFGE